MQWIRMMTWMMMKRMMMITLVKYLTRTLWHHQRLDRLTMKSLTWILMMMMNYKDGHLPAALVKGLLLVQKKTFLLTASTDPADQALAEKMKLDVIHGVQAIENWDTVAMIRSMHSLDEYLKDDMNFFPDESTDNKNQM